MTEIPNELLDELLKDHNNPADLIGKDGLLKQLTKRLLERAMDAEMDTHLGYKKNESAPRQLVFFVVGRYVNVCERFKLSWISAKSKHSRTLVLIQYKIFSQQIKITA